MSAANGINYTAQEFIDLKARVKAEMQRRRGVGSLAAYAGSEYDFTVTPTSGGPTLTEHGYKIWFPMEQINDTGVNQPIKNGPLEKFDSLETLLATAESQPMGVPNNSSCMASCSGLCQSSCTGGCYTTCTSSCSDDCTYGCRGGCEGGCDGMCPGGCAGYCTQACGDTACGVICEGSCYTSSN